MSTIDGGGWSASRPSRLTPGQEQWLALSERMCGPLKGSGRFSKEKTLATTESRKPDPPVLSLYRVFHTKMQMHQFQVTITREV